MLPVSAKKSQNTVMPRMSLILYEYQSHTQRLMIACVTRPGASEALYQSGQKILPQGNHLFDNPSKARVGLISGTATPWKPGLFKLVVQVGLRPAPEPYGRYKSVNARPAGALFHRQGTP